MLSSSSIAPLVTHTGRQTQNGKFFEAAKDAVAGKRSPECVRVYEKIRPGIWAYDGVFQLVDAWTERDEFRRVCKFRLKWLYALYEPEPRKRD